MPLICKLSMQARPGSKLGYTTRLAPPLAPRLPTFPLRAGREGSSPSPNDPHDPHEDEGIVHRAAEALKNVQETAQSAVAEVASRGAQVFENLTAARQQAGAKIRDATRGVEVPSGPSSPEPESQAQRVPDATGTGTTEATAQDASLSPSQDLGQGRGGPQGVTQADFDRDRAAQLKQGPRVESEPPTPMQQQQDDDILKAKERLQLGYGGRGPEATESDARSESMKARQAQGTSPGPMETSDKSAAGTVTSQLDPSQLQQDFAQGTGSRTDFELPGTEARQRETEGGDLFAKKLEGMASEGARGPMAITQEEVPTDSEPPIYPLGNTEGERLEGAAGALPVTGGEGATTGTPRLEPVDVGEALRAAQEEEKRFGGEQESESESEGGRGAKEKGLSDPARQGGAMDVSTEGETAVSSVPPPDQQSGGSSSAFPSSGEGSESGQKKDQGEGGLSGYQG